MGHNITAPKLLPQLFPGNKTVYNTPTYIKFLSVLSSNVAASILVLCPDSDNVALLYGASFKKKETSTLLAV